MLRRDPSWFTNFLIVAFLDFLDQFYALIKLLHSIQKIGIFDQSFFVIGFYLLQ